MASAKRPLTTGEWASLSPGLAEALRLAGAEPRIVPFAHPAARVSKLWRGKTPILTRGDEIWWPRAPWDFTGDAAALPVLQHELQHVLEYAQGRLTAAAYLIDPRNWTYDYKLKPESRWTDFGAEQRASIVEELWRLERDKDRSALAAHQKLIPWSRP
jgi:hypothetical protein